jgi:hypothetical protein
MPTKRRRQLGLPVAALMTGLIISAAIPVWISHGGQSSRQVKTSYWQMAVYRFDTGVISSCEAFAREIAQRSPLDVVAQQEDRWERIPPNPASVRASMDCLVQAGLMVV